MMITAEPSFTYDGEYMKNSGYFLNDAQVSSPEISPENVNVPGRIGLLNMGNDIGARQITLEITLNCSSQEDFNEKRLYLENLVILQEPVEKPLILDTDTKWTYYGQFTALSDFEWLNGYDHKVTLTFSCSDPLKYGEQYDVPITDGLLTITPHGQQKTSPIFSAIATADNTWCGLSSYDQYVYVGGKIDVESGEEALDVYTPVLQDTAQDLNLWQRVSNDSVTWDVTSGNVGKGSDFQQNDDDISVKEFGENQGSKNEWYGPALKRMMTKELDNWKVTWRIRTVNRYARAENKLELYLLDGTGKAIGKLSIKDDGNGSDQAIYVQAYTGTGLVKNVGSFIPTVKKKKTVTVAKKQKVKTTDKKGKVTYKWVTLKEPLKANEAINDFSNFYGYIEFEKVGNKFFAKVVKMDETTRNEVKTWESVWTDTRDTFKKAVAGFGLYAGKRAITEDSKGISYKANYMAFCDLRVYERIQIYDETIISSNPETIIFEGDEIVFDCESGRVYKNGQLFMEALHNGSDWITLYGGVEEQLAFAEGFDWTMHYRPTAY